MTYLTQSNKVLNNAMNITNQKLLEIIVRLLEKTNTRQLHWEITASDSKYLTSLPKYSVIISEEGEDYVLYITNPYQSNAIIERVADGELREIDPKAFVKMRNLYESARRNARGADQAVDDILNFL